MSIGGVAELESTAVDCRERERCDKSANGTRCPDVDTSVCFVASNLG